MKPGRFLFSLMYLRRPPWDSGICPPEVMEYMETHAPGRAIDLGCGTGTNVVALAEKGWQVTGVDFVPRAIRTARKKIKKANLQADIRQGDVTSLAGIEGPFDLALDIGCFHAVGRKSSYLDQLQRILAPDGQWLVYGFLKSRSAPPGIGLTNKDIQLIGHKGFRLLSRTDNSDERNPGSTWMLFERAG
jgi:ubiquinone/menaquinone biosynthesis C-methylase UbiE